MATAVKLLEFKYFVIEHQIYERRDGDDWLEAKHLLY